MNRLRVATLPLLSAACGLVLAFSLSRLHAARVSAGQARALLDSAAHNAREVLALRQRQEMIAPAEPPSTDTQARVTAALAAAGIPATRLKDLSRDSERPADALAPGQTGTPGEPPARRTLSMRVTIEPVTVQDLGAFLAHWSASQRLWTVSRLDLTHAGPAQDRQGTYSARLVITAEYTAERRAGIAASP